MYGFVVCSVQTPDELIENYKEASFLFPWVVKKHQITEFSPHVKQNSTVQTIQGYNGTDLLLLTTTLKFYMDIGLRVYDCKKFIQFRPSKCNF